jgi:hypothetical protein
MPGNNSGIIRKAIEKRSWWIEIQPVHSMYNFKWQPTSHGIKFERMGSQFNKDVPVISTMGGGSAKENTTIAELQSRQLINHVENHHFLTEKCNLLL